MTGRDCAVKAEEATLTNNYALADIRSRVTPEVDAITIWIKHNHRHISAVEYVPACQSRASTVARL
jgi:hypothetical protein